MPLAHSTILAALLAAGSAIAVNVPLFDFEGSPDGWEADWGLEKEPVHSTRLAAHGEGSLMIEHQFSAGQEAVAVKRDLDAPRDFAATPGFAGLSAWIYFPKGTDWQGQIYVCGSDADRPSWGTLHETLGPGWHKILMHPEEMGDAHDIRVIGIQIKNFKLDGQVSVYLDYLEAVYSR